MFGHMQIFWHAHVDAHVRANIDLQMHFHVRRVPYALHMAYGEITSCQTCHGAQVLRRMRSGRWPELLLVLGLWIWAMASGC